MSSFCLVFIPGKYLTFQSQYVDSAIVTQSWAKRTQTALITSMEMERIMSRTQTVFESCDFRSTAMLHSDLICGLKEETPPQHPEFQVVEIEESDVPISAGLIATTDGSVIADIRARVSGCLLKQSDTEGALVKKAKEKHSTAQSQIGRTSMGNSDVTFGDSAPLQDPTDGVRE